MCVCTREGTAGEVSARGRGAALGQQNTVQVCSTQLFGAPQTSSAFSRTARASACSCSAPSCALGRIPHGPMFLTLRVQISGSAPLHPLRNVVPNVVNACRLCWPAAVSAVPRVFPAVGQDSDEPALCSDLRPPPRPRKQARPSGPSVSRPCLVLPAGASAPVAFRPASHWTYDRSAGLRKERRCRPSLAVEEHHHRRQRQREVRRHVHGERPVPPCAQRGVSKDRCC